MSTLQEKELKVISKNNQFNVCLPGSKITFGIHATVGQLRTELKREGINIIGQAKDDDGDKVRDELEVNGATLFLELSDDEESRSLSGSYKVTFPMLSKVTDSLPMPLLRERLQPPPEALLAAASYERIGELLADSREVQAVKKKVQELVALPKLTPIPFLFAGFSSGCGKSQLAFALRGAGCRVFHFYMGGENHTLQKVYGSLLPLSYVLVSCLRADKQVLSGESYYATQLFTAPKKLFTAGFISMCLKGTYGDIEPMHLSALKEQATKEVLVEKPFVFVLDEVPESTPQTKNETSQYLLFRNILRAATLPALVMGTDASAANFLREGGSSRSAAGLAPWAYIIRRLPKLTSATAAVLGLDACRSALSRWPGVQAYVEREVFSCRPWFAGLLIETVQQMHLAGPDISQVELLDQLRDGVATKILHVKDRVRKAIGVRAQVIMLQASTHPADAEEEEKRKLRHDWEISFVTAHFAYLDATRLLPTGMDTDKKNGDSDFDTLFVSPEETDRLHIAPKIKWTPRAVFPSASEESILYLALSGTRHHIALLRGATRLSAHDLFSSQPAKVNDIDTSNPKAASRSGEYLEALACSAMILASHNPEGGLKGVDITTFLCSVCSELVITTCTPSTGYVTFSFRSSLTDFCQELKAATVPFLSPANSPWPSSLQSIVGVRAQNIVRPQNNKNIDVIVGEPLQGDNEPILSAECKYHADKINLKTMKSVLQRVPRDARRPTLHLFFCDHVQESYFSGDEPWSSFCSQHLSGDVNVVRVVCDVARRLLSLRPFKGMHLLPATKCHRLVVVIPLSVFPRPTMSS